MIPGAVARRYAQAVFEIATEQQTVDRWLQDVRLIADYLGNKRLSFVLGEPNIPFARKRLVVQDLLGDKVQPDALGLALLLVERGLTEIVPRLRDEYMRRYNDYYHQAVAQVTTAMPLDEELRRRVTDDLQRITGKRILLQERVDPSILGGAVARVGDTLLDGSVRRRLQLLRQQIERGGGSFGGPSDGRGAVPDGNTPSGGSSGGGGAPTMPTPMSPTPSSPTPTGDGAGPQDAGPSSPSAPSSANDAAPRASNAAHLVPSGARKAPPAQQRPAQQRRPDVQDRRSKRGKRRGR